MTDPQASPDPGPDPGPDAGPDAGPEQAPDGAGTTPAPEGPPESAQPAPEAAAPAPGAPTEASHSFGDAAGEMTDETEGEEPDELALAQAALAERTSDLQRLQAEYANYRKRVERDRQVVAENATYTALVPIIDVLDTIDRAREHDELDGGFKAVAEQLERIVAGLGLTRYGEVGDAFDHHIHDALSHIGEDPDVTVTTCKVIAKSGYKIGDRVVRPAQVLVVDPPA